jgi:hypothetical protein
VAEGANFYSRSGTISYWIKPNFFPEHTGKPRCFSSLTTVSWFEVMKRYLLTFIFGHYFMWDRVYLEGITAEQTVPEGGHLHYASFRPASMVSIVTNIFDSEKEGWWFFTPTLNHIGCESLHDPPIRNTFEDHVWVHIIWIWGLENQDPSSNILEPEPSDQIYNKLLINGRIPTNIYPSYWGTTKRISMGYGIDTFTLDRNLNLNPLCIGGSYGRSIVANIPGDVTIDEVYLWSNEDCMKYEDDIIGPSKTGILMKVDDIKSNVWSRGRYYRSNDALFTSGGIDLGKMLPLARRLVSSSEEVLPGSGKIKGPPSESSLQGYAPLILGVSWTAYTEGIEDWAGVDQIEGAEPKDSDAKLLASLLVKEESEWVKVNSLPMRKYWWEWIYRHAWEVKYQIHFDVSVESVLSAILLATPILDDFTIYYRGAGIGFLNWILV